MKKNEASNSVTYFQIGEYIFHIFNKEHLYNFQVWENGTKI